MLPLSLRLVYALNSATFQVSSLALLSIVNTRVSVPAEYLPAYYAISFLPYSLRPIFAWLSSSMLRDAKTNQENRNRHDKLLFPAFLLASLSFVGTIFIPSGGIIPCFVCGFLRGIAGAWSDFLIGMSVIELSKLQARFSSPPSQNEVVDRYEHIASINTSQSSTARNVGSFLASVATFAFFAKNKNLGETVANTLLLGTAATFLLASLVSLKYQFHVGDLLANLTVEGYDTVNGVDFEEHIDDVPSGSLTNATHYTSSFQQSVTVRSDDSVDVGSPSSSLASTIEDIRESNNDNRRQIVEVSTLVAFQILLAVSALQKPIIAVSNKTTWILLVSTFAIIVIFTITLGYRYESKATVDHHSSMSRPSSNEKNGNLGSQAHKLPHRQLSLYFLLRYSMPIAGFLMHSYLYSVFESEPMFLQLLDVLKTAIGSISTFCYEKFLSPYCHSGWPLIGLIASLDITMGLVSLLDVWVIRAIKENEVDGNYSVDTSLKYLIIAVGLTKYFFAELDYMPALVLSTTNVYSDDEVHSERRVDSQNPKPEAENNIIEQSAERTSLSNDFARCRVSSLSIDLNNEAECDVATPSGHTLAPKLPMISTGMQYASFLSCIDFGAQIGDWITIPIVASLGITRENHWDHLDKLVMLCSIFRMTRVVFLWLICPQIPQRRNNKIYNSNTSDRSD